MSNNVTANLFDVLQKDTDRTFCVAEAGLNHGGSKEKAMAMVRAAKWAEVAAVKFQTFKAELLNSRTRAQLTHTKDVDLQDLFKKLELDFDAFRVIHSEANRIGIEFLSTPFDEEMSISWKNSEWVPSRSLRATSRTVLWLNTLPGKANRFCYRPG